VKFDWSNPYRSARLPVFARNVVSTSHPLAAQAGVRIMQNGGNAIDGAIAAAAVMTVVEPCSNGLGSDAFALVWDGNGLHGLNASGAAPEAWTPEYFRTKYGAEARTPPNRGWDSVTVPGAVGGWVALSERFGLLPFSDLLTPAIDIAERGYSVPYVVQQKWRAAVPLLQSLPGWADAFMPHGRAPEVGERFAFPAAAKALRAIAKTQGAALYGGEIAEAAAAHAHANGGAMSVADFEAFKPQWVEPIGIDVYGHRLHEIPPNGQGIAALVALGILRHFDLESSPIDSVQSQHLQIEAMKLAFADVYAHVGDPRSMRCTPEEMLSEGYLRERARLIDPRRAQLFSAGQPQGGGTIYLTAADERGMMVSFIQSNFMGFGSGIVIPGWGVSMQNRGFGFSLEASSPNCVAPGRRPFHTIIPAFLTKEGRPQMSFGIMGGNMQPQAHVQTLVRMLAHGQQPQTACDAPRWRFNKGLDVSAEGSMDPTVANGLIALGHRLTSIDDSYMDFGGGQFVWLLGDPGIDGYVAASDPRRDGQAAGY
jgi:gamma-glutamyltranspeptidase/glutathione hydrolase